MSQLKRAIATGIDAQTLGDLIASGNWRWFYGEAIRETVLEVFSAETNWDNWLHGCVFSDSGEFTWWRLTPTQFECRHLTMGAFLPSSILQPIQPVKAANENEHHLLHGRIDLDNKGQIVMPITWSDARIPHYLTYPLPTDSQLTHDSRVVLETQLCTTPTGQTLQRLVAVRLAEET